MRCQKCGKENSDEASFCNYCGVNLKPSAIVSGNTPAQALPESQIPKKSDSSFITKSLAVFGFISICFFVFAIVILAFNGPTGAKTSPPIRENSSASIPVPVRMSMKNGVVTADVTNTEITSSNFTLSIDFYHNTTELVDWEVELPPLDPGKSTSISYFAPSGANRYKLDGVDKNFDSCIEALCRGGPDVEYNVTYVPATE